MQRVIPRGPKTLRVEGRAEDEMTTYLDEILETHRKVAADDRRSIEPFMAAATAAPMPRGFRAGLIESGTPAIIAEIKRRSPSKGDLAADLDPAGLARAYERGGAACLSVLTDVDYFGGSAADLAAAHQAVTIPVLRKDFTVCAIDVYEARLMGADCILLIVAALTDGELSELLGLARKLALDVLVEAHDEAEVERGLAAGADLIGVNQRDLETFEVDTDRAVRVASAIPAGVISVAESGIRTPDDARRLLDAGYRGLLVGESLVTSGDPTGGVEALRGVGPAGEPGRSSAADAGDADDG